MLYIAVLSCFLSLLALLWGMKRDLMMLQQNSNRNDRYRRWMRASGESTRMSRLVELTVLLMFCVRFVPDIIPMVAASIAGLWIFIKLITAKYKKPLVFTKRATRIYAVSVLLAIIPALVAIGVSEDKMSIVECLKFVTALFVALFVWSYAVVMLANWLLKPVEKRINRRYYNEAAAILASMPDLKVIGITGSYGKTSTKHYLHRILSEQYDVLMTPGNFNTTLGVIRTVREYMKPYNSVFIVEMGAKQVGDIKEICDLVHPSIGIITAVGPQHLESFKTIERVQATKFELIDSLPADGLAVINDDFEFIANRPVDNTECTRYAVDNTDAAAYRAENIEYTPTGTRFTVTGPGDLKIELFTHLVGKCNISNLLAAIIVALRMGVSVDKIRYAVEKIEQVEHRLNIKRTGAGITLIDDAYNSNPVGSAMALEVLAGMKQGRRFIITPGMIELGEDQQRLNREFGEKIADAADVAIVVGEYNRDAILAGIADGHNNKHNNKHTDKLQVHTTDTFAEAQQLMLSMAKAGDTVLYENDLPDTFK